MKGTTMKRLIVAAALITTIAGCSTFSPKTVSEGPSVTPIQSQKLTSNFVRRGIKVEFDCKWYSVGCNSVEPTAIEVTATATSNGNSESNRETAFTVAEMNAKAKLRRFIQEDITTTQVTNTISKNIEKANDRIKHRITNGEEVEMSDNEAAKDTNWAIRENTNDITRTVTDIVRVNASGILRGVATIDERIVDRQTVQVTIRWDRNNDSASQFFNKKFGTQK
jgi:predicted nucleic acid-binding protein